MRKGMICAAILGMFAVSVPAQTYFDDFAGGASALGFEVRQEASAFDAVQFLTADDPFFQYEDNPVANSPGGDSAVMMVGNLDGSFYGIAEATLFNNDVANFEEMTDVTVEAWVYVLTDSEKELPGSLRTRTGIAVRDTSPDFPDSGGNGQEGFPPQFHYDGSGISGPGFGTSGLNPGVGATDDAGDLIPISDAPVHALGIQSFQIIDGGSGYVIEEVEDVISGTRTNDFVNVTVLPTRQWVRMRVSAIGNEMTCFVDIDGDGQFEEGTAGLGEVAFYPSIGHTDSSVDNFDPNDIGRPTLFTVTGDRDAGFNGIPDTPVFFDNVTISAGAPVSDWNLY